MPGLRSWQLGEQANMTAQSTARQIEICCAGATREKALLHQLFHAARLAPSRLLQSWLFVHAAGLLWLASGLSVYPTHQTIMLGESYRSGLGLAKNKRHGRPANAGLKRICFFLLMQLKSCGGIVAAASGMNGKRLAGEGVGAVTTYGMAFPTSND